MGVSHIMQIDLDVVTTMTEQRMINNHHSSSFVELSKGNYGVEGIHTSYYMAHIMQCMHGGGRE